MLLGETPLNSLSVNLLVKEIVDKCKNLNDFLKLQIENSDYMCTFGIFMINKYSLY